MLPEVEGFDPEGPMWQSVVREYLLPKRNQLLEELAAFQPDATLRDRSDFTRGRLEEINELIALKQKPR